MDLFLPPLLSLELPEIETLSLLHPSDRGGVRRRPRCDTLAIDSLILLELQPTPGFLPGLLGELLSLDNAPESEERKRPRQHQPPRFPVAPGLHTRGARSDAKANAGAGQAHARSRRLPHIGGQGTVLSRIFLGKRKWHDVCINKSETDLSFAISVL